MALNSKPDLEQHEAKTWLQRVLTYIHNNFEHIDNQGRNLARKFNDLLEEVQSLEEDVAQNVDLHEHTHDGEDTEALDHGAMSGLTDDDHTQYRLESEDHTHASTGLQGGSALAFTSQSFPTQGYIVAREQIGPGDVILVVQLTGDSQDRFQVYNDGELVWGPGDAALDVNLYRSGVNILKTDDSLEVVGGITQNAGKTVLDTDHSGAADPHTGYRLESADHSHATTGLQAGTVSHDVLTGVSADDHHAQAHGASDHTNRDRYIYLPVEAFTTDDAVLIATNTSPDLQSEWRFADGVRQGIYGSFLVPADCNLSDGIDLTVIYRTGTAASATVRWVVNFAELVEGDAFAEAGAQTIADVAHASTTTIIYDALASITPSAVGTYVRLNIERAGAAAEDTDGGNIFLLGVRLDYTADM